MPTLLEDRFSGTAGSTTHLRIADEVGQWGSTPETTLWALRLDGGGSVARPDAQPVGVGVAPDDERNLRVIDIGVDLGAIGDYAADILSIMAQSDYGEPLVIMAASEGAIYLTLDNADTASTYTINPTPVGQGFLRLLIDAGSNLLRAFWNSEQVLALPFGDGTGLARVNVYAPKEIVAVNYARVVYGEIPPFPTPPPVAQAFWTGFVKTREIVG